MSDKTLAGLYINGGERLARARSALDSALRRDHMKVFIYLLFCVFASSPSFSFRRVAVAVGILIGVRSHC